MHACLCYEDSTGGTGKGSRPAGAGEIKAGVARDTREKPEMLPLHGLLNFLVI